MNDLTKQIQLIFVVETNEIVKSDNAYILWLLKKSYSQFLDTNQSDDLFITYDFVYMDGKKKYNKPSVLKDINTSKKMFSYGESFVIYCVDIDGPGKEDMESLESIKEFVNQNKFELIVFYREIEDIFKISIPGSKAERVKYFSKHYPKKDTVNTDCLICSLNEVVGKIGYTNFNTIIDKIIKSNWPR